MTCMSDQISSLGGRPTRSFGSAMCQLSDPDDALPLSSLTAAQIVRLKYIPREHRCLDGFLASNSAPEERRGLVIGANCRLVASRSCNWLGSAHNIHVSGRFQVCEDPYGPTQNIENHFVSDRLAAVDPRSQNRDELARQVCRKYTKRKPTARSIKNAVGTLPRPFKPWFCSLTTFIHFNQLLSFARPGVSLLRLVLIRFPFRSFDSHSFILIGRAPGGRSLTHHYTKQITQRIWHLLVRSLDQRIYTLRHLAKTSTMRSTFTSSLLAAAAVIPSAFAHYNFEALIVNGNITSAYEYVRQTNNSNSPITDVTSSNMICNSGGLCKYYSGTLASKSPGAAHASYLEEYH
jgi:hypothetical protein